MAASPRIVLMHATPIAIAPVHAAFAADWPEAEIVNLLDDGLSIDRSREPEMLSDELAGRFVELGRYAYRIGADGVLATCSAFGPAIDRLARELPVPVVKPNEAMFEEAAAKGTRIGMLATFAPAIATMEDEFRDFASRSRSQAVLTTVLVPDAIDHLRRGDVAGHNERVSLSSVALEDMDVLMLAHFSTSVAAASVRRRVTIPILTAPHAAVARMRHLVTRRG